MATAASGSGKRRRKSPVQLVPESNVPVEIAMEELERTGEGLEVTKDLLAKQSRLVKWQIRTEQLRFATKIGIALLAAIVMSLAAVMIIAALRSHEVIVQAFETPPFLAGRGINGKVVASRVQDALAEIQAATRTAARQRDVSNEWTSDINVEVPQTGVSVGEIDRLLRRRLGRNTYVDGDLVQAPNGDLTLTVRAPGIAARTFSGPPDKLTELATKAAEYVYGRAEPRLFATYLNQNERYQDTVDFLGEVYSQAPDDQRAGLANSWGNALSSLNRNPEALEKYTLAVQIDPYRWTAWGNIVGVGMQTYGEGYAYSQAIKMRQRIAQAPPEKRPRPGEQVNLNLLFQEWTDLTNEMLLDSAQSGGGTATTTNNTELSDTETRRHDRVSANRYLAAAQNSDPTKTAAGWFNSGFRALEDGKTDEAVRSFKLLDQEMHKSTDVTFSYMDGSCWLGLAYGLNGQPAEAKAVFDRAGKWVSCYAFQADSLEAQGKRAEADAAYAKAVALVPGVPFCLRTLGRDAAQAWQYS
jgi:tetratricopeptide (TPR) repeat protein